MPLLWVSCPLVHAPTSGPSGLMCAVSARPGATPMALPHQWGLGSAQADSGLGFPRPRLAAGPNPRHGLVLGLPVSLR